MKQGKNLVGLVVMGVAILFALLGYFTFSGLQAKTDKLVADNKIKSSDVAILKDYQKNSDATLKKIADYETEMKEIMLQFPKEVRPEDLIMYSQSFEQNDEFVVSEISMPVPNPVLVSAVTDDSGTIAAAGAAEGTVNNGTLDSQVYQAEGTNMQVVETTDGTVVSAENIMSNGQASTSFFLYNAPSDMRFEASYDAMKNIIKKINEDPMRKSLEKLQIAFNEEKGVLTGSLAFNSYFILGSDVEYVPPVVNGVGIGTEDIFRSADRIAAKRDIDPTAAVETTTGTETGDTKNSDADKKKATEN